MKLRWRLEDTLIEVEEWIISYLNYKRKVKPVFLTGLVNFFCQYKTINATNASGSHYKQFTTLSFFFKLQFHFISFHMIRIVYRQNHFWFFRQTSKSKAQLFFGCKIKNQCFLKSRSKSKDDENFLITRILKIFTQECSLGGHWCLPVPFNNR